VDRVRVIRLVTQFDPPSTRVTAATPTCCCGGCSCCCCCIVTAIAVSTYSAVSAQGILRRAEQETPERVRWRSPWPGVVGFFSLTASVVVIWLIAYTAGGADVGALLAISLLWVGLLGCAYWGAGARRPWLRALAVVAIGCAALVVEFFLWASGVDTSG
jgi:hypothetical protein